MYEQPHRIELVRHRPAGLDGLVAGVVGLSEHAEGVVERRQPADSLTMLRLSVRGRMTVTELSDAAGGAGSYSSFVAGFMPGHAATHCIGPQECIQVYLTPLGVRRILGVPGGDLARRILDISDVAPELSGAFLHQLADEPGWAKRFHRLESMLRQLAARGFDADPVAEGVWREIVESAGTVRVAELVEKSGWSHRRLVSRMRGHVGVSPKSAACVVRFEQAMHAISGVDGLAAFADRHGYADQSHLTRDFARYAAATPAVASREVIPTAWTALGHR